MPTSRRNTSESLVFKAKPARTAISWIERSRDEAEWRHGDSRLGWQLLAAHEPDAERAAMVGLDQNKDPKRVTNSTNFCP